MGFFIDMIHVGQGDAFLLTLGTSAGDVKFLIDAGPPSQGKTVAAFVREYAGGHLHAVIGSHLDMDHIGGLKDVVAQCSIDYFYLNLPPDPGKSLKTLLRQRLQEGKKSGASWDFLQKSLQAASDLADALRQRGLVPQPLIAGQSFNLVPDIRMNVLNPTPERLQIAWEELEKEEDQGTATFRKFTELMGVKTAPETSAENNSSVVLELIYKGELYALLTADAGADVLKEVTQGKRYPFLKVPHHGSKTGLDEVLINQLRPETAFIPVGDNNYGHPAIEILDLLKERGVNTYCSQKTSVDPSKCINNR